MADLRQRGIVTKAAALEDWQTRWGHCLHLRSLAHLLRNRFYIGEVSFDEVLAGEQPAIIDRERSMRSRPS
jgi:hypothetical protein